MSISTLAKAPLIETVFELRWELSSDDFVGEDTQLEASESLKAIIEKFEAAASRAGYTVKESVNEPLPLIPYFPKFRFRQAKDSWPLFRIGAGILTVNQINDGYNWESFQSAILEGVGLLAESHHLGTAIPLLGIELRYVDGFSLQDSELLTSAIKSRFTFQVTASSELISNESIKPQLQDLGLEYQYELINPPGILRIQLRRGKINGENGLVIHIVVRTAGKSTSHLSATRDVILEWTKEARAIQQHAFRSLITTEFFRTFE